MPSKLKDLTLYYSRKGSAGSGDWGHRGRPGKVGGSGGGGGLATLGLTHESSPAQRRGMSRVVRTEYQKYDDKLEEHYKLIGPNNRCQKFPEECQGLTEYTGSSYALINTALRKNKTEPPDVPLIGEAKAIKAMDNAFERFPRVPMDIKVTRGISPNTANLMTPGTIFKDHGYTSTTISQFPDWGEVNMVIRVPKGSKGIYLDRISEYQGERELLLNRGSRFNVISRTSDEIVAELLPD